MGESDQYGVGPVTLAQPHQHVHPSFSGHSGSFFPGFGLPGPSARFPGVSAVAIVGRGILMHRRRPGSSKSPSFIAISHFIGEMTLIDGVTSLVEVFNAPKFFTFLQPQISQLPTVSPD